LRQRLDKGGLEVMGLRFPNPVGLAAGMDKDGDYLAGLGALGFGFIEVGTVTPRPQPGNPKPRLFRIPRAEALINRMGFNNKGVDHLVERVRASTFRGVLGINIGKNLSTPVERALDDYRLGLRKVYPHAAYVAVNISSPNTPGLRDLQRGAGLDRLLEGLESERETLKASHGRYVPLAVKIAPDLEMQDLRALAGSLQKHHIDAVIATNTTSGRPGVAGLPQTDEAGGLSGAPLLEKSTETVARLADRLGGALPIIACGGILSGEDARRKIAAGACLVQIYSGLIYRGSGLVREIVEALS
jgi:dihydroorotate dehydrogenase